MRKNMHTPAYPSFAVQKWGLRGYTFHGHVFLRPSDAPRCSVLKIHVMFVNLISENCGVKGQASERVKWYHCYYY